MVQCHGCKNISLLIDEVVSQLIIYSYAIKDLANAIIKFLKSTSDFFSFDTKIITKLIKLNL